MSLQLFGFCCEVKAMGGREARSEYGGPGLYLREELCPRGGGVGLDSPLKGAVMWGPGSGKNRGEVGREEQVEGTAGTEARRQEGAGTPPPPP